MKKQGTGCSLNRLTVAGIVLTAMVIVSSCVHAAPSADPAGAPNSVEQTPSPEPATEPRDVRGVQVPTQPVFALYTNIPHGSGLHGALNEIVRSSTQTRAIMPPTSLETYGGRLAGLIMFTHPSPNLQASGRLSRYLSGLPAGELQMLVLNDVPHLTVRLDPETTATEFLQSVNEQGKALIRRFVESTQTGSAFVVPDTLVVSHVDTGPSEFLSQVVPRDHSTEPELFSPWLASTDMIEFLPDVWSDWDPAVHRPQKGVNSLIMPMDNGRYSFEFDPREVTLLELTDHPMFGALEPFTVEMIIVYPLDVRFPWFETEILLDGEDGQALSDTYLVFLNEQLLDGPLLIPRSLLGNENALAARIAEGSAFSASASRALAGYLSRALHKRENLLLIPFTPVQIGGQSSMKMPESLRFDLSGAIERVGSGLSVDLAELPDLRGALTVTSIERSERPAFSLWEIAPDLVTVHGGSDLGFDFPNTWQEYYPRAGSGAIFNYLPFPSPDRVPLIVFISPDYSYRQEEAVQAIFGVSQADLAARLAEEGFFYEFHPWRDGFPETLLVGVQDTETLFQRLENDPAFRNTVNEFYAQEYAPGLPKTY